MSEERIIHTTGRNNCGSRCIIHAHVCDDKITKITTDSKERPDGQVPLCACVKGFQYHKTFLGEDRLRYPMKRIGKRGEGKFERISWKEAVDTIVSEWIRIRDQYGPGSRYVNYATGVDGVFRGNTLAKRLLAMDGGYLDYYNSYSTGCIAPATRLMYGTSDTGHDPADWLNSNLIILWSHNPAETKFDGSTMYYLKKAKEKGIRIVVVDPRENDTVRALHAEWIPIFPTTDAAMMDAMAYVIYSNGLQDQEFLDRCCIGFDGDHMPEGIDPKESYVSYLMGEKDQIVKTPEWAEKITGVPAETIRQLAIDFAMAKPSALIQGYGAQRHSYGEQSARGGITLACMTGNVGISGGWASGHAEFSRHHFPALHSGKNPYDRMIPVYAWTEAIERGTEMSVKDGVKGCGETPYDHLDSNIKMILNLGGNCLINQHGDINRTKEILEDDSKCEFIVVSDLFMTSSAKFADILLPGISLLESENITVPWKYGDFIGYNNIVVEPLYEGRFEYDWLREVADKLGYGEEFSQGRTTRQWLEYLYEEARENEPELPPFETLKKEGIYYFKDKDPAITFARERKDPDKHPFPTESGKIEIFSKKVYETEYHSTFPAIPGYVPSFDLDSEVGRKSKNDEKEKEVQIEKTSDYPLFLIGWHTKRRCHSIHDNNKEMHKIDPQKVWMNPTDAQERGIKDGDMVDIWNDRGRVRIPVFVTERVMKGVTALSQGAWYQPDEDGVDLGGCINTLTSLDRTPYAQGNPQHTIWVEIEKH